MHRCAMALEGSVNIMDMRMVYLNYTDTHAAAAYVLSFVNTVVTPLWHP